MELKIQRSRLKEVDHKIQFKSSRQKEPDADQKSHIKFSISKYQRQRSKVLDQNKYPDQKILIKSFRSKD